MDPPIDPLADEDSGATPEGVPLTGIKRVFAQLIDKPTDADIKRNVEYIEECKSRGKECPPMAARREILSWLIYDWANSPMFQVALGLAFPTALTTMATRYACENNVPYECDYNDDPINSNKILRVSMGGWELKPSSYAAAMVSISAFIQAFFYITVGALADYGTYQHYLFRIMSTIAASMLLAWIFFDDESYFLFVGWWGAVDLVCFGLGLIFYNAYLPELVANHWRVRRSIWKREDPEKTAQIQQTLTDEMSQYGYACGYCGSFWATIVAVGLFYALDDTTVEILEGYGTKSYGSVNSYDEEWAKPVMGCKISYIFDYTNNSNNQSYITSIQLHYDDINLNGSTYGDSDYATNNHFIDYYSINTTYSNTDYINKIKLWYTNENTISAIQFTQISGIESKILGNIDNINNNNGNNENNNKSEIIVSETDSTNWIFSGYIVYTSNKEIISRFDFLFMDKTVGQYGSLISYQAVNIMVGVWWLFFQLFAFFNLHKRKKQDLPMDRHILTVSVLEYYETIKKAKDYPNLFKYLVCWFLFSDATGTMAAVGVLFAQTELDFTSVELILLVFELEVFAAIGAVLFVSIQNKLRWNTKKMLLLHITLLLAQPIVGLCGLIPNSPFGLVKKWEMHAFTIWFGLNTGSMQSYSRSFFAQLVPYGLENQMFSLYEITDKGSSWIGPLIVAFVSNEASMRWAFFYVLFLFSITIPAINKFVSLKAGLRQAGKLTSNTQYINEMVTLERPPNSQHSAAVSSQSNVKDAVTGNSSGNSTDSSHTSTPRDSENKNENNNQNDTNNDDNNNNNKSNNNNTENYVSNHESTTDVAQTETQLTLNNTSTQ